MDELRAAILPEANWADRFEGRYCGDSLTAIGAVYRLLQAPPAWMRWLMTSRNAIVKLFGLKRMKMAAGDEVGGFPIISVTGTQVVMGLDDHHLDFRIVVDVSSAENGQTVGITTLVNRKNAFGYVYIFLVTPFHRCIVPATLRGFCEAPRKVSEGFQNTRVNV